MGGRLVVIADGRDVWQVFHDEGMIGNTRVDLCSRILKRDLMRRWLEEHQDPASTTVYLGFDWTEPNRIARTRPRWAPWSVEFPLEDRPLMWKADMPALARSAGIEPPSLTVDGFAHANCGGACVKAGQSQWKHLLETRPAVFAEWEGEEQAFREAKGKDVSILRDRRGGITRPLPLRVFRERMEAGGECDLFDTGGCGCVD